MSGALRNAARQAHQALIRTNAPGSLQQQRFGGNLPVKNNPHVENWSTRREHIEDEFRWDGTTFRRLGMWVVALPVFVYAVSVAEFNKTDKEYERKEREFM